MYTEQELRGIMHFLSEVILSMDSWHMNSVVEHIKSPQVMKAMIDNDAFVKTHQALARNPNASPEILVELYEFSKTKNTNSDFKTILKYILANPNVPVDFVINLLQSGVLDEYLKDCSTGFALAIAQNQHLPLIVIRELVMHLSSVGALLEVLRNRKDSLDSTLAEYIYNKMRAIHSTSPLAYAKDLALVKTMPAHILEAVYHKSHDYKTRVVFARNPNTPSHILSKLAFDTNLNVRLAALANSNMPPETLAKACHIAASRNINNAKLILKTIVSNPSCPKEVLLDLTMYHNKFIADAARKALGHRQSVSLAQAV
ncbi:hypothetical protein MTAT_19670 [Moorella thermoacetica]|uniref:Leucine rich repeat variant n=1 Tax=Neomoorella thermoacetica TaxID=1525 RepID=A0AAC9HIL4_NEOTH|nr:Leucine rich repeat variant [Moorella thermoacetica]TYL12725.1 hypothetical protein MTAT_19670 [Moorella thermoacetica]